MKTNLGFLKYTVGFSALIVSLYFLQVTLKQRAFVATSSPEPIAKVPFPKTDEIVEVIWGSPPRLGKPIQLEKLLANSKNGLLVNFWATWCPPCIEELPSLENFHRMARQSKAMPELILISVDEGFEPIKDLMGSLDFKPTFRIYLDRSGNVAMKMGSSKFPETYLVSEAGAVRYKWVGPQDWLSVQVLEKLRLALSNPARVDNQIK